MVFTGRIRESAAATKTFGSLRIDRRVLSTPTRTIAIDNIATVSVGTHVAHRPTAIFWLMTLLFVLMDLIMLLNAPMLLFHYKMLTREAIRS